MAAMDDEEWEWLMYHLHKWSQEEWETWLATQSEATQAYYYSWNRRQNDVLTRIQQQQQQQQMSGHGGDGIHREPEEPEPEEPKEPDIPAAAPANPAVGFVQQVHMAATGVPMPGTEQAVPAGPEAMQTGSPAGPAHEGRMC
ncbi:unnamed protein product [Symbiodinium microadriaticum]|nr:unnamed protein product [Symbiodinium microadriaticum]